MALSKQTPFGRITAAGLSLDAASPNYMVSLEPSASPLAKCRRPPGSNDFRLTVSAVVTTFLTALLDEPFNVWLDEVNLLAKWLVALKTKLSIGLTTGNAFCW